MLLNMTVFTRSSKKERPKKPTRSSSYYEVFINNFTSVIGFIVHPHADVNSRSHIHAMHVQLMVSSFTYSRVSAVAAASTQTERDSINCSLRGFSVITEALVNAFAKTRNEYV